MARRKTKKKEKKKYRGYHLANLSLHNERFIDRELSWIAFNERVLAQAMDRSSPLLERVKFLSIFQSNLDEFFMKRIQLLRYIEENRPTDEYEARIGLIRSKAQASIDSADELYAELSTELANNQIYISTWEELSPKEKEDLEVIFKERIFPVLTPIAVDPGHPFPHISNLSNSLAVALRHPKKSERLFARIKIPKNFPLIYNISTTPSRWIYVSDIIINNLSALFLGMEIYAVAPFRVTRNIEVERDEDTTEDILAMMERELRERRFGEIVRVEFPIDGHPWLKDFLQAELEARPVDFYLRKKVLDFSALKSIQDLPLSSLKISPWKPTQPQQAFQDPEKMFSHLASEDVLVHHPYESFHSSVELFIQNAVNDPKVLSIKLTLYRTEEDSALMGLLIRAAEAGKQVVCIVEIKARFDEERNISWANELESAGVHVIYGIVGLKTHAKVTMIAREEKDRVRCYAHIGTGNYNSVTARLYTDYGLLTSQPELTGELTEFFHYLTGHSLKSEYKHLLVAPVNMKDRFLQLIENEIANKEKGLPAHILFKCNNLEDFDIGEAIYRASQTGVKVDLIVRSICTLRPQAKNLGENIRVISIVDRFLEHSRVFYFRNASKVEDEGLFFFGSADLMFRNLLARVEVITPIFDNKIKTEIWHNLMTMLSDTVQAWEMQPDGSYLRLKAATKDVQSSQTQLMEFYQKRNVSDVDFSNRT